MILYIDPGTGAMLFSLMTGLISVIWYGLRKIYLKLKYLTLGKKAKDNKTVPLVIFAEEKRYWRFFEPICRELDRRNFDVLYYTESNDDPVFECNYPHVTGIYIGENNKAYKKLNYLNATIVLSTTPGLDVYQWKRSKEVKYYVYLPHATNAMTTIKMFGLDFYDAILTSGQYQTDIIRKLESIRNESPKEINMVGIPYMDDLVERINLMYKNTKESPVVLLAPSWGKSAVLGRFGGKIIERIKETGYHIIIRPHPQSFISESKMIEQLMKEYPESDQIEWDRSLDNFDTLNRADIMISDFSGVVFEFALAFDKPVICLLNEFDESPYDSYWLDDCNWAVSTVPKLGVAIDDGDIDCIKDKIEQCLFGEENKKMRDEVCEETWQYRGEGAKRVVDYLIEKYNELND